jgi:DNA-binding protein HU-beta
MMNKKELADRLAGKHGFSKAKAKEVVDDVFDEIADALSKGKDVAIDRFGRFKTSMRKARKGINPRTGKPVDIKASKNAAFKAAKKLKDSVNR